MRALRKIQIINSRIEVHFCGLVFDIHFIPAKSFRHYLTKKLVFANQMVKIGTYISDKR